MPKERKPLPNPLDNVLKTGTIGGNTKPAQESTTTTPTEKTTQTDTQKAIYTDIPKAVYTDTEEKIKQTIKIKRSLIRRVKIYVATHDKENISTVIEKALNQFLDKVE